VMACSVQFCSLFYVTDAIFSKWQSGMANRNGKGPVKYSVYSYIDNHSSNTRKIALKFEH
jgi:hypothetical protein